MRSRNGCTTIIKLALMPPLPLSPSPPLPLSPSPPLPLSPSPPLPLSPSIIADSTAGFARGSETYTQTIGLSKDGWSFRSFPRLLSAICLAIVLAACEGPLVPLATAPERTERTPEDPPVEQPEATPEALPDGVPALAISDARAGEADGTLRFNVSLSVAVAEAVTVSYATEDGTASAGDDYQPAGGTLTFPAESYAAQWIEVRLSDDEVDEDAETFILRLSDPVNAELAVATATATIVDDDQRAVTFEPLALNVLEGGTANYTVVLGSQPTGPVTVTPAAASAELTLAPAELRFTPAAWQAPRTVTVTAGQDGDAVADAPVQVAHAARGGGYEGASDTPVSVTIVEDDVPTLAVAASHASEGAGTMRFAVTLSLASDGIVTVDYATSGATDTAVEGQDYTRTTGTLRFPARSTEAQTIEVTVRDDTLHEPDERFSVTLSNPVHATLAGGQATFVATGRIDDDDLPPRVAIGDASLSEGDGAMRFAVSLEPASGRTVTVDYATADGTAHAGADYTAASGTVTFSAGATAQTIAVPVADDARDEEDRETFTVRLYAAVNASSDRTATGTIEDDDMLPRVAIGDASLSEGDGAMRFAVSLDPASGRTVTVDYATAEGTASAGSDFTTVTGTLRFPAATTERMIPVPVLDDQDPEDTESFTVTLSAPVNATVAPAGRTATGSIEDHDQTPQLSIADASLTEGSSDETMNFTVSLDPASGRTVTVDYATAEGTATAGSDFTTVTGTLTLQAGSTTQTIPVTILADSADEEAETFTVTLSNATGAALSDATATGTIIDHGDMLALSSLQVTGAGSMYPAFAADTYHYALTCNSSTTLHVRAQALRTNAQLTLLRADENRNVVAAGTLATSITVNQNHDIAIELSDAGDTVTYVVHCLPANFPDVRILKKTAGVSEDLMLVVPKVITGLFQDRYKFATIMDNNGVPRFHKAGHSGNFRAFSNGTTINGRQVQYSLTGVDGHRLYDQSFRHIRTVTMPGWDPHDFLITEDDTLWFMGYKSATRNASHITNPADGTPYSSSQRVRDVIIQERTLSGRRLFRWNSWDHLNIPDCILEGFNERYAQINAFQLVDGDIVASFRNCHTVLRIDRSGGTGAVEWQVGGSSARDAETSFLRITGDDEARNEFCSQHNPTQVGDKLVVFDNGDRCAGPRKADPIFSRVVEYDISSGTEARFSREYRRLSGHGYARYEGGVSVLDNGNWLIFWGYPLDYTVGVDELITISEVNPQGEAVFRMNMSGDGYPVSSYRVYRMPESEFKIPWNLP